MVCFPTKRHWRDQSVIGDIISGLAALRAWANGYTDIDPIMAVPMLGCGLGGLPWDEVRPLIIKYLGDLPSKVLVYGEAP